MGKSKEKPTKRYSNKALEKALETTKNGESLLSVSRRFQIPYTTLRKHSKGEDQPQTLTFIEVPRDEGEVLSRCLGCSQEKEVQKVNAVVEGHLVEFLERKLDGKTFLCNKCNKLVESFIKFKRKCLETLDSLEKHRHVLKQVKVNIKDELEEFQEDSDTDPKSPESCPQITKPKVQKCKTCSETFTDHKAYNRHVFSHRRKFECHFCGKGYHSRTLILSHLMTKHSTGKRCYICRKLFWDINEYKEHMKMEKAKPNESKVCDICGHEAPNDTYLHNHKAQKHSKGPFVCQHCGKVSQSKTIHLYHIRTYHKERKISCNLCGKKFVENSHLRKHNQTFHEERQKIMCSICGSTFVTKLSLKKHMIVAHTNNFDHECKLCGKLYKLPQSLQKHYFSHLKLRPYNCHLCTTGYYKVEYLLSHYGKNHGIQMDLKGTRDVMRRVNIREEMKERDISV